MKALTYQGKKKVEVKEVADPKLEKKDDILVRITTTAICGSDLHIYNGEIPGMHDDYVIGHEPMGIVEEVGPDVTRVKKGDRVIIPFNVACGQCFSASMRWRANATMLMTPRTQAVILVIPILMAVLLADKLNCCGYLMVILGLL